MAIPHRRRRLSATERDQLSHDVGLSSITLGRYLAGEIDLAPATVRRIEDSIRDLGLGSGDPVPGGIVILIVPELATTYFAHMAQAVEREVLDLGWDLLVTPTGNEVKREVRLLGSLSQDNLVGVLLFTNNGLDERLLEALSSRHDVVAFAEAVPDGKAHTVVNDMQAVGQLAGQHLAELGHRHFAYIGGPPNVVSTRQIGTAFQRAIAPQLKSRDDFRKLLGDHSDDHGYRAMHRLAQSENLPTAVFAGSSPIAQGVLRACAELEIAIPQDLSLIGYDGTGPLDLLKPALTSVTVSLDELAHRGIDLLRRGSEEGGMPIRDKVAVMLDIRKSTAAPRRRRRNSGPKRAGA